MLEEKKLKQLHELLDSSSKEELVWINQYLSGIVGNTAHASNGVPAAVSTKKISLAFGTETGNAKRLATHLATVAKKKGVNTKLVNLDQYRFNDLAKEEYLFVVISTQGEGEPPIPVKKFYDQLMAADLKLSSLKFSVLALGDTSYPLFCKTGEDVDARLENFGGSRVIPLQRCDVDYEADAEAWFGQVLNYLQSTEGTAQAVVPVNGAVKKPAGKKHYKGRILSNINLNDRGSRKQTYHIEIGADEEIAYESGDTIGIIPLNRQEVVDKIISLTGIDEHKQIVTAKSSGTVRELLTRQLNICYLMSNTVKKYAAIISQEIPDTRMDLVDLLRIYPVKNAEQFEQVVGILLPIAPRLYSVASSPAAHGNTEVHITVAKDRFLAQDEQRYGLCSEFLGDKPLDSELTFYVHKDKNFKLPLASEKNIIMIGPGTGVAPFRAFLAERDATGATGKNWFFFGEQHFASDFLYQTEIQNFFNTGVLTKLNLAFSRDQAEKIYVQHRMLEQGHELFEWISGGAHVYISGTKDPMSKDVEQTLLNIIQQHGHKSLEEAKYYLEEMRKEGRYEKDVY